MADDVLEQLAGQSTDPMLLVSQQSLRIARICKVVSEVAFDVNYTPAQVASLYKLSHTPSRGAELTVMPGCQLESLVLGKINQFLCLVRVRDKRLLYVHVCAVFEAEPSKFEVSFRRSRDVDNIRMRGAQHLPRISEVMLDGKPIAELLGHQGLAIADCYDLAILESQYLRHVGIGDFAASHNGNPKHAFHPACSFGKNDAIPPRWTLFAPSPAGSSIFRCYTASSSNMRAIVSD